jgi:hypothetical protein
VRGGSLRTVRLIYPRAVDLHHGLGRDLVGHVVPFREHGVLGSAALKFRAALAELPVGEPRSTVALKAHGRYLHTGSP